MIRTVSEQLHEDWELLMIQPNIDLTTQWISTKMLRPFLFFVTQPSSWYNGQQSKTVESILKCFKIILNSINSTGMCLFSNITFAFTGLLFVVYMSVCGSIFIRTTFIVLLNPVRDG